MKEGKLFSLRLFCEGFRQLKIPSVLMTIFYSLIVVIEPMERISDYYLTSAWDREPREVDFHNIFYVLNYTAFLIVPVLIFWLFRFMMKRSTSDFYHSLPVSRVCLTVSFFAAALTWMTVILLAQTAVGILIHALYPAVFVVDYSSILAGMLGKLTVGLLSGGYTLLALALTGTMMSGMATAVLLAYLPMFASMMLCEGMEDTYRSYNLGAWKHPDGRVALRSFINNFEDALELNLMNAFDDPKHSVWQILVTLLIGVAVFLLAVLMMRFRKSETAGKPAICQGVHVAIRISGTLFVLWFLGDFLFGSMSLVAIILALVAYLSYELLTTRRWYNLLKSLVWLPLVAILYFVPYLCGYGIALLF